MQNEPNPISKTSDLSAYTALTVLTPSSKSAALPTSADRNARVPRFDNDRQSISFLGNFGISLESHTTMVHE